MFVKSPVKVVKREVQHEEEEHNIKIRGFREVIDLMTSSRKPIVAYDCLKDFSYIHSKFLAPLPPSLAEFMCSLRLAFQDIVDVDHVLKEIGPLRKAKNLPAAISYLRRQFFAPITMEIPQDDKILCKNHGHSVLRVTHVFAKLCSILNITPSTHHDAAQRMPSVEEYSNIFSPCCTGLEEQENEDGEFWMDDARKVTTSNFIFLWGFREGTSARSLKMLLQGTHSVFSEDFELRLIEKSCAIVISFSPWSTKSLLKDMETGNIESVVLMDLISDGLKAAGYDSYKRVCKSGLWHANLADSLDNSIDSACNPSANVDKDPLEMYWPSDSKVAMNDLF